MLLSVLAVTTVACGGCSDNTPVIVTPPPPPPVISLALHPVATGLTNPLYLTAPTGDSRLFVVEKPGRIRIVKAGVLQAQPFLDLSAVVSTGGEQGLLGLAFHPRYASNGRFVVDYTDAAGDTHISTFKVSDNGDRADPASEQVVLVVPQPYANHNGGDVVFGPDGMLYVGMGDGGSGGDPQGHGQNSNDLLGSLLRLDIHDDGSMAIPADNPFVGQSNARAEPWNVGLRNPWRFSFDRSNGDLYIADVGQDQREEVDVSTAASGGGKGLNYGWNIYEGTRCFGSASLCTGSGFVVPVLEYQHTSGACSITGGFVYRGAVLAGMQGTYFYADYCAGWVRSFRYAGGQATAPANWTSLAPGGAVLSFGQDAAGELYLMNTTTVFRIIAAP